MVPLYLQYRVWPMRKRLLIHPLSSQPGATLASRGSMARCTVLRHCHAAQRLSVRCAVSRIADVQTLCVMSSQDCKSCSILSCGSPLRRPARGRLLKRRRAAGQAAAPRGEQCSPSRRAWHAYGHWPKATGPRPLAHIQTRKAPRGRSSPAPLRASLTRRACTAPSAAVMTAAAARCAYSRCGGRSLKGTEGTAL